MLHHLKYIIRMILKQGNQYCERVKIGGHKFNSINKKYIIDRKKVLHQN
jgi:hypothetical protein